MGRPTSWAGCLARRPAWAFRRAAWRWCGAAARPVSLNLMHALFLVGILWLGSGVVERIPIPALAGVTAWMGLCLLDWSAWRRLPKMSRVDASAFLGTAIAVLAVNAVLAVGIGCSIYGLAWVYQRRLRPGPVAGLQVEEGYC